MKASVLTVLFLFLFSCLDNTEKKESSAPVTLPGLDEPGAPIPLGHKPPKAHVRSTAQPRASVPQPAEPSKEPTVAIPKPADPSAPPSVPTPKPAEPPPIPPRPRTPSVQPLKVSLGNLPSECKPVLDAQLERDWNALSRDIKDSVGGKKFLSDIDAVKNKTNTSFVNYATATRPAAITLSDPNLTDTDIKTYNLALDNQHIKLLTLKKDCIDVLFDRMNVEGKKVSIKFGLSFTHFTGPTPGAPKHAPLPKIAPFNTALGELPQACEKPDIASIYPTLKNEWKALNIAIPAGNDIKKFQDNWAALVLKYANASADAISKNEKLVTSVSSCQRDMRDAFERETKRAKEHFGVK